MNSNKAYTRWMCKSTGDLFSKYSRNDMYAYSDIENIIIEEALNAGKTYVMLDGYYIDFKRNLQISTSDTSEQRPVKRIVCNSNDRFRREERFLPNPVTLNRPFGGQYGFVSPFIKQVVKELYLTKDKLPSKNETILPSLVEKAARGIIEEGKICKKTVETERIAKILIENKQSDMKTVWKCCVKLYTMNGFLFKTVNEFMRMVGNEQQSAVWRSKTRTLGPYCLLLWDNPFNSKITKPDTILYRGVELSNELINIFKDDCRKNPKPWRSFQAFTSCTRNVEIAEIYGNTLFIMTTRVAFTMDIQKYSMFPDEEEELLFPGVCFTIDRVEYDDNRKRHLVYLTLKHKYNKSDKHELQSKSMQRNQINEDSYFDFDYFRRCDFDYDDYDDDTLEKYYKNRDRSAVDRVDLRSVLTGNGIDITSFTQENHDLLLHSRLDRYGLREAWTDD